MTITTDEWMEALQAAMRPRPGAGGKSTHDLVELMGVCPEQIKKALRQFQDSGRLVVSKERRPSLDGCWRSIPVYSIKAEKG